jgi:NAD(P)-dependent dehydrogenase (short-subunit alcohol dehydrogenase family)
VGGYHDGDPVDALDLAAWDVQMELNLRSAAITMRAVLPGMVRRRGGRVVAVSTRAAVRPFAGASAYAASKAGLIALVGAASEEVKQDGVTVNCVLPSVIDTPGNRAANPDADASRWVRPEEIGEVLRFLLSPQASAVTGAAIPVYGRA